MLILISIAAFLATMFGGLFALKFKDRLHLILGFSAGAVIGVAFFDLIPEALEFGGGVYNASTIMTVTALGFVTYLILDRFFYFHTHDDTEHSQRGVLGAGSISVHSFLDGTAIGLAFQVSAVLGAVVALAVLAHGFSDGVNTVGLIIKNGGIRRTALCWLSVDAIAPVLGIASTMFFTLSAASLGLVLALFAGFFLYIGASDLLPESHHTHPTHWTTIMTILGIVVLYGMIALAGL
ncbi:MAG: ZIP family metal transporter [Candidatus Vogelbacteria bacterium]|nr:ZIP family metal transporter [Candidatus Vogelbacteria bacterium]